MHRSARTAIAIVLVVLCALVFIGVGVLVGANPDARNGLRHVFPPYISGALFGSNTEFPLQSEVLDKLEESYYREFDPALLEDGAIKGMLSGLDDPYTDYFSPEAYARFLERTEGSYSGVGIVVEARGTFVTVVSTFKGSPAEGSGVRPGDVIVGVDDDPVDGLELEQVVAKIKGPEGTEVTLEMYRPKENGLGRESADNGIPTELPPGGEVLELTMVRKAIDVPVVEFEMLEVDGVAVAHIKLTSFCENSALRLRAAVEEAIESGGAQAIIFDLRNNGGGLVNEAVDVASIFIPSGVIVTTEGIHSPREVLEATGNAYPDVPLYVLVNEFSASASEIVAGAIKDHERGELIGETTFGKGLVQKIESLSDGGALKVTIAVYLTPNGNDINGTGVTPDVEAPDDVDTEEDETLEEALLIVSEAR